jgi:hypothetical protein
VEARTAIECDQAFMPLNPPPTLISADSPSGSSMLRAQPASSPVWALLLHFATQATQSFCSVATAAVMLNALGIQAPVDPAFAPYPYFTQANMFGACALALPSHSAGQPLSSGFIATHGSMF